MMMGISDSEKMVKKRSAGFAFYWKERGRPTLFDDRGRTVLLNSNNLASLLRGTE